MILSLKLIFLLKQLQVREDLLLIQHIFKEIHLKDRLQMLISVYLKSIKTNLQSMQAQLVHSWYNMLREALHTISYNSKTSTKRKMSNFD
jgi:hypothetical protein